MTKKNNVVISVICVALIALALILTLVKGLALTPEFGGSVAVSVKLADKATVADLNKLSSAVGGVVSSQILDNDTLLVETGSKNADLAKIKAAAASAIGVGEDQVNVASNQRTVTGSGIRSVAVSLLIAGAVVIVWFIIRFGVIPAVDTLFGFIVVAAVWILPYAFGVAFDYKAFTVLAVGLAIFALQAALVFAKRVKNSAAIDPAPAFESVVFISAAGIAAAIIMGIVAGIWSVAIPLAVTLAGSCFTALYGAPACVGIFKK